MRTRQRRALEHPVPLSDLPLPPHHGRIEHIGEQITILTVSEPMEGTWVWHASVSFGRKPLGMWSKERTERGDRILRQLLDGVGDQVVFGVMCTDWDLDTWKADGLIAWPVRNDPDVLAYAHPSLGTPMLPPHAFRGMHLWKTLTEEELRTVREKTEARDG